MTIRRLPRGVRIDSIIIGNLFPIPANPESNITVEVKFTIELPAGKNNTGRQFAHKVTVEMTVPGLDKAVAHCYEHVYQTAMETLRRVMTPEQLERALSPVSAKKVAEGVSNEDPA